MNLIANQTNNIFKVFINKIHRNATKRSFRIYTRMLYSEINSKNEGLINHVKNNFT